MCCSCLLRKLENVIISFLEKRYPGLGFREIVRILNCIRERLSEDGLYKNEEYFPNSQSKEEKEHSLHPTWDLTWKPMVVPLGLICKVQMALDDPWYDSASVFISKPQLRIGLSKVFGFYWHYYYQLAHQMGVLRDAEQEELRTGLAEQLQVQEEDVVVAHVQDAENLEDHTPDTALVIHHDRRQIVLSICGTKVTPRPSLADIMMDLHADTVHYLAGRAHQGLSIACTNVLRLVEDKLVEAVRRHPEYTVVVLGYSLGAGVAQLSSLKLLQGSLKSSTKFYCLSYGPPPVYRSEDASSYSCPNIIHVVHDCDGLSGVSLHTFTQLLLQVRAVDSLNLTLRRKLELLKRDLFVQAVDASTGDTKYVCSPEEASKEEWRVIMSTLDSVRLHSSTGFDELDLVGGNLFILRRSTTSGFTIRHLRGSEELRNMTSSIRLRPECFNHHLPWGYNKLFQGVQLQSEDGYNLDLLDEYISTSR